MKIVITALGLFILGGCKSQQAKVTQDQQTTQKTTPENEVQNGIILLKERETKFVKDKEMNITFKKVVEDSRCPEGMQCIWAGLLVVEIEVIGTYTRPQTFTIATTDYPQRNLSKTVDFNGYTISLESFSPTKALNKSSQPKILGLKIEKTTTPSRNSTTR